MKAVKSVGKRLGLKRYVRSYSAAAEDRRRLALSRKAFTVLASGRRHSNVNLRAFAGNLR